jgi:hypothetical protein
MRCKIEVVGTEPRAGVSIWCDTCNENVAWKEYFTVAEVVATAAGHREVMKRARAAAEK